MTQIPAWDDEKIKLRDWQGRAYRQYITANQEDFLLVATPGAGKSLWALRAAHSLLSDHVVERIVIVVPTANLKEQWARTAHEIGIELDPNFQCKSVVEQSENRCFHGIVVTYQQVCMYPEIFDYQCRQRPTLVISDEIHHAGLTEELDMPSYGVGWGPQLKKAFDHAERRIAISGTPFRSDNNRIPFVVYEDGKSRADFSYGYADALADGVCRPIYFPSYEGKMEWLSRDERIMVASFRDGLNERDSRDRLRTAIDPKADFLLAMLRDAHEQLMEIREGSHADAGGLVIAKDQAHAQTIKKALEKIARCSVEIAVSDDPDASETILRFAKGNRPWLVAVKMVSEGVDIPRLRVGVYATVVRTELFFRQVVGRFVRQMGPGEECAYLYVPRDPNLVLYIQAIKQEREHYIQTATAALLADWGATPGREDHAVAIGLAPVTIAAEGDKDDVFDQDGGAYNREEMRYARQINESIGRPVDDIVAAQFYRAFKEKEAPPVTGNLKTETSDNSKPLYKALKEKKKMLDTRIRHYVAIIGKSDDVYKKVNADLKRAIGKPRDQATMADLDIQLRLVSEWIERALR